MKGEEEEGWWRAMIQNGLGGEVNDGSEGNYGNLPDASAKCSRERLVKP